MDGETSTVNVVLLIARTKVINHFAGEYFFLSNFYPCRVAFYGMCLPSVEAAFQAAKCATPNDRVQFLNLAANQAKSRRVRKKAPQKRRRLGFDI